MNVNQSSLFSKEFLTLLLCLAILLIWRFFAASSMADDVSLYIDEAQYWFWSRHLDFGFYSKPPIIALIIAATTSVCGDSELCIRAGSLIIYPFTTVLIFLSGSYLFDKRTGLISALVFLTMPAVSLSSLVISTDVALFFFWALAFYSFIRALDSNDWHWWLLVGLAGGLGMESKYTMGIFVFSAIAYLLFTKQVKQFINPRIWVAAFLAAVLWVPNLWWNSQNQFITFVHTSEISDLDQQTFHWNELADFFLGQFFVFGPIAFALFLYLSLAKGGKHKAMLLSFSWMFLGIILLQAFLGRANANWAAPAYVGASIMLAAWLVKNSKMKLLLATLLVNLALTAVLYHSQKIVTLFGYQLSSKTDLHKRLRGWRELGHQFNEIQAQYADAILLGVDRTVLSHLAYHSKPIEIMTWNPQQSIRHHYDLYGMLEQPLPNQSFLLVIDQAEPAGLRQSFKESKILPNKLKVVVYPDVIRQYDVYYLKGFKGYQK